jgi:hypothetical protein
VPEVMVAKSSVSLRSVAIAARPVNPVLQRLQERVLAEADASEVITSYDPTRYATPPRLRFATWGLSA